MATLPGIVLIATLLAARVPVPIARHQSSIDATARAVRADTGLVGHWEGELKGESKIFAFAFDFTRTGKTYAGTLEVPSLDQNVALEKITVNGNSVSFDGFGKWTGTLSGDELTLTRELDYGKKQHMTAHRVARSKAP